MSRYDLISSLSFIQPGALRTPSCLWRGCRESWWKWRGGLHLLQHTDSNTKTASKWGSINGFIFLQRVYSWHIVSYYGESSYYMARWHYIDTSRLLIHKSMTRTLRLRCLEPRFWTFPKLSRCAKAPQMSCRDVSAIHARKASVSTPVKSCYSNATTNFARKISCWCQLCL